MKKVFKIRVTHSLGFFSIYEIEANDYWDAEKEAKQQFLDSFCGGTLISTFRGEKETHSLEAYTFNKYSHEK